MATVWNASNARVVSRTMPAARRARSRAQGLQLRRTLRRCTWSLLSALLSALLVACAHSDHTAGKHETDSASAEREADAPQPTAASAAAATMPDATALAADNAPKAAPEPRADTNDENVQANNDTGTATAIDGNSTRGMAMMVVPDAAVSTQRSADAGSSVAPETDAARALAPDQTRIVPETADRDALRALTGWSQLPVLQDGHYLAQSSHDRGQANPDDASALTIFAYDNRDMNNFVCKSADTALGAPRLIRYQFDLEHCPETYVHGAVLARYEGSGRLLRFWMTATSLADGAGLDGELLRIYVDDDPLPRIQAPLSKILSGTADEIFAPPFGAGSSAYIAWYYPVVFGHKLVVAMDRLTSDYYFQTDAVLDARPLSRVAPASRLVERDTAATQLRAASPVSASATSLQRTHFSLGRDERQTVELGGPATIEALELRVPHNELAMLSGVHITVRWDDASQPAVDLPLLDLFAASRTPVARGSLALTVNNTDNVQTLALRLPMPYRSRAEWTLHNLSDAAVDFELAWIGEPHVPSAEFGYLNVQRRNATLPTPRLEHAVAQATGRGRFVGMCADLGGRPDASLDLFSSASLNLLEGDFRARVDGALVLDGTGTEDYPDSAFYFLDSPQATPFAQNWGLVDDPWLPSPGQVSFCRWQVLGSELDFQHTFELSHEIAQYDTSIVDLHRTIAFLYLR